MSDAMSDMRMTNTGDAIREGLTEVAIRNPAVIFLAEGAADPSSVYGTIAGLAKHIGPERIIEMPVAENALTGVAIGAAMMGKRPVISFHRVEFALLAMEQIVNNAAKAHYISCGRHRIPLVIRMVVGRGWGQGPEHSQSLETMFALIPGLKVLMPTYPRDAKGMIISAVEDDNPVMVIEHRWCHYVQGQVPSGYYTEPLDGPNVLREGKDLTIVSTSYMTLEAMRAAEQLERIGCSATVLDMRVIRPLMLDRVFASVAKTGRLITVDTGFRKFGIGAEIVSEVVSNCFDKLKSPPIRIGLPDHPTPSSRGLVPGIYPDAARIVREAGAEMGIAVSKIESAVSELVAQRKGLPVDVPDPFFKGPF
ncbi:MAG: alpha-ketoacid dehydrogenase subunit beta [Verrucomicrobia bacterium]|nr:alpha-ketoacid dehydrogenase subunit beta [Verrucomicrobiota bacterium]